MNENSFEKIDDYLHGRLNHEERMLFETEMASNEELAGLLKIYAAIESEMPLKQKYKDDEIALKQSLNNLNQTFFNTSNTRVNTKEFSIATNKLYKIIASIAAILIIVAAGYFLIAEKKNDPKRLANNYINENLTSLSQSLSASKDSMQQGIAAYNDKDFTKAISIFEGLYKKDTTNAEAVKNAGLSYLLNKDYDKALDAFDILSKKKNLFSNPALFFKAITLLQRNKQGDKEKARQLLQLLVKEKAEGSEEAEKLLQQF